MPHWGLSYYIQQYQLNRVELIRKTSDKRIEQIDLIFRKNLSNPKKYLTGVKFK